MMIIFFIDIINDMQFQHEKKSWLLSIFFMAFCLLLFAYPQPILSDNSNTQSPFPSILFGEPFENEDKVNNFNSPDGIKTLLNKLVNKQSKQPIKTYGPVRNNENLWTIADKLRTDQDVLIVQMAIALFNQNPNAFLKNNINGLINGVTLSVPEKNQIIQISKSEADFIFQQHLQNWKKDQAAKVSKSIEKPSSKITNIIKATKVTTVSGDEISSSGIHILENKEPRVKESRPKTSQVIVNTTAQIVDEKADLKPLTAFKKVGAETKNQRIDSNNENEFIVLDYISNIQFQYIFKDIINGFSKSVNMLWRDIEIKVNNSSVQDIITSLPIRLLIFIIVFIALIYYFRKREDDYIEVRSENINLAYVPLLELEVEKKPFSNTKPAELNKPPVLCADQLKNHKFESKHTKSNFKYIPVLEQNIEKASPVNEDRVFADTPLEVVHNQLTENNIPELDIESELKLEPKPALELEPEPEPELEPELESELNQSQQINNKKGLLETAFENQGYFSETGFIQEKEQINEEDNACCPLDSKVQIKYIHEMTRDSKIDAFLKMTHSKNESSLNDILANELSTIKDNEKVDVFIEEFEQLLSSLSQQTPILEREPNELENLIQYKLSIHFIKVLSDMMQANYLMQFSQTVIEFLEDIVDGKTQMSSDILTRLYSVVSFYDQYINFVKHKQPVKIEM